MNTGEWISGGLANGWYVHRFDDMQKHTGFGSGYGFRSDRSVFIGECVAHKDLKNNVVFLKHGNTRYPISGVNVPRKPDSMVMYTPQYDATTGPDDKGVELVIEFPEPVGIRTEQNKLSGFVKEVRKQRGQTPIPFDSVVLSAEGKPAVELLAFVQPGDKVELMQDLDQYDEATCSQPIQNLPWNRTFSALGGAFHYLKDGKRRIYNDTIRHPRTVMAFNAQYIFFFVVDGRTSQSRGMYIDEISEFAQQHLKATDGIALDGGGSSTLVIDGKIMNHPSDGVERTVSNAVLIGVALPKEASVKFRPADPVLVGVSTVLYAGPGTNFNKLYNVNAGTTGYIDLHKLDGIRAKGTYWWKVRLGGLVGWADEAALKKSSF